MSRKSFDNYPHVRKIFLSCMVIMLITLELQAQTLEQKLNLNINLRNATLQEFIKKIEEMTDYSFIYGEEVKIDRKISINLKDKTIEEILRFVFKNEPIDFEITGNYILLQKKTPKPEVRKYTVSGYITDESSMETLIGANIFDSRIYQGTTTNPYGYYSLTLPEGEVEISFSYLGYTTQKKTFVLKQDTRLNINLEANNVLDEVIIYSDKTESGFKATHTGAIDIPMAQIRNTPVVLGEADVMKTIQSMPGVHAGVEGSAGLYVRGGSPDQNLILLDGVPVYNVDHLLGFFSVFTPEAVKKVTLYKSSFPARFGGRLSSVIDVRTNDGDMNNYHGSFSLGLLSTRLNAEGPVIKDKTSFNISLRRTYLDLITRPFMKDDSKVGYYFYDITAKVNHKFSDKDRLFLSFYHGNDYLRTEYIYKDLFSSSETDYMDKEKGNGRWGNTILSTRWNRIINNKLFGNTTLAFNQYKLRLDSKSHHQYMETKNNYHTNYRSGIRDVSLNINYDYNPIPKHHIKFGGTYLFHNFKPEVMTSKVSLSEAGMKEDTIYNSTSNSEIYAHELSLYAEDDININSRLKTNIGLHVSGFHVQGKTYFSMQPRLATRYQLNNDVALKASYSKMNQYINLLTSAPISMPTDLWVPVTKKIKPMDAHQYSLGAYYTGFPGWELSVETYYKDMKNVLEYKDGTHIMGSSTSWEDKVEMGKGRSYGIEFMVQKTLGQSTGWISYALAKSDRKFARGGINNGERFPFKYDRRHSVDFIFNHKFSDKIDLGTSWTFMSGATASVAHEVVTIVTPHKIDDVDYIEGRNNYRLPPSHCLNVGINFHKKKKYGMRTWNFSVYNLYNTMNPTFVHRTIRYRINNNDIGEFVPEMKKFTLLPLLPSATYTYRF